MPLNLLIVMMSSFIFIFLSLMFASCTHRSYTVHVHVCRKGAAVLLSHILYMFTCKMRPLAQHQNNKYNVNLFLSCLSGSLIQLPSVERGKLSKVRLGSLSLKKEGERQCFLFTKHFLVCTRSSGGKLHLLKVSTTSLKHIDLRD